jgi:hypothetical protein
MMLPLFLRCFSVGVGGGHGEKIWVTRHGAARSLLSLAPPLLRLPRGAPSPAPHPEPLHFAAFGRAPAGAARGAADGALPNMALVSVQSLMCKTKYLQFLNF